MRLELTEKQWDAQIFNSRRGLAPTLGWKLTYHTLRSKGSTSGFPDRVLIRDRIIFAELKSATGKPTPAQIEWLTGIAKAGGEAYLWLPGDLDDVGKILAGRYAYDAGFLHTRTGRTEAAWQPACLWLPERCRADQQRTQLQIEAA